MRSTTVRLIYLFAFALLMGLLSAGCDAMGEEDTSGTFFLKGQVLNAETNNPVPGAVVRAASRRGVALETVETGPEGRYDFAVEIDSTMELQVTATKDGITSDLRTVLAKAGEVKDMPDLQIAQIEEPEPEPGRPSNIRLLEVSPQSISVKESGGTEVANLTFQVTDSTGRAISLDAQTPVRFSLARNPGDGAFVAPEVATTDNSGKVTVNLSSGARAGVVQILAEAEAEGRTIRSKPVSVTVHGGLPDEDHFTLGPAQFNFPGLRTNGLTNPISVIVGDVYSNPVKPGTAVYFDTDAGVIEGSALTDAQGRGTVDLISARPYPARGIGVITAHTADSSQAPISQQIAVIFSDVPEVEVTPTRAVLDETYTLTLTDRHGNPLAPGTQISVRAEGTKVKATGNVSVTLDDPGFADQNGDGDALDYEDVRRGPGITEFTFRAVEDREVDEDGFPDLKTITVIISGPNGRVEIVLTEKGNAANSVTTPTEGARVEMRGSAAVVHAPVR